MDNVVSNTCNHPEKRSLENHKFVRTCTFSPSSSFDGRESRKKNAANQGSGIVQIPPNTPLNSATAFSVRAIGTHKEQQVGATLPFNENQNAYYLALSVAFQDLGKIKFPLKMSDFLPIVMFYRRGEDEMSFRRPKHKNTPFFWEARQGT